MNEETRYMGRYMLEKAEERDSNNLSIIEIPFDAMYRSLPIYGRGLEMVVCYVCGSIFIPSGKAESSLTTGIVTPL